MIEEAQAAAQVWKDKGVDSKLVIQSSDLDAHGKTGAARNFMNQGVNAIIINPNNPTAFGPVSPGPRRQASWWSPPTPRSPRPMPSMSASTRPTGRVSPTQWLAEALGGKGNAVTINGVARHPANETRVAGYREVFEKYWTSAERGQRQLGPGARPADHAEPAGNISDINDVWVQDGLADGA